MREKFIQFLKTNDLNLIGVELYKYFNEKSDSKMELDEFVNKFNVYLSNRGSITNFIEDMKDKFKINCIIHNNKIINYY